MINQMMRMKNNLVKNYLCQTQQLYGDKLILKSKIINSFGTIKGPKKSQYVFIKSLSSDNSFEKKEIELLKKILKALKLTFKDIIFINVKKSFKGMLTSDDLKNLDFNHCILFGYDLGNIFKKENFENKNLVLTYSIKEIIDDSSLKKKLWDDIKFILKHNE